MTNKVPEIIDISSWKQDIDHAKVAAAGVKVAICRTTCSQVSADLAYMYHVKEFAKHRVVVPGYMFPRFDFDVVFQVKCFLAMLQDTSYPTIFDLEQTNDCRDDVVARKSTQILQILEVETKKLPLIYTRGMWFDLHIAPHVDWAGKYPLWVSHYTMQHDPILPKGWSDYDIWQYTDKGRVPGVRSSVDFNRLSSNLSDAERAVYLGKTRKGCRRKAHKKR